MTSDGNDIDKIWKESGRNNEKALELVKAAGGTRDDFQKWKDNKKENDNRTKSGNDFDGGLSASGNWNFDEIYDDVMNGSFEEGSEAEALQLGIKGNLVQTGIDTTAAQRLAYTNAAIASDLMNQTANLELANTTEIMAQEQQYGLAQMTTQLSTRSNC